MLDFKKAFDHVDLTYIWTMLQAMGLGWKFLSLTYGLILSDSIKIHINGRFLESIKRVVCQGCPLVPMLFSLTAQPLLAFFKEEHMLGRLKGVWVDDNIYICERLFCGWFGCPHPNTQSLIQEVEDVISLNEQASGAKLHLWKSIIIPIGMDSVPNWLIPKGCQIFESGNVTKYMGAPLGIGITLTEIQEFCLDRVCKHISLLAKVSHFFHWQAYLYL